MAQIPDLEISTRPIENAGKTFFAKSYRSRDLAEMGGALGAVGNALERIAAVKQRADERESDYAVMQATDYCKNGYEGWDKPDGKGGSVRQRGILDFSYDELQRGNTTIGKETTALLDSVRKQDFYKRLSPSQRAAFERKWQFRRNEFLRSSETAQQRLTQKHIADELKGMISKRADMVAAQANNTPNFTRTARWAATQNMKDIASSEIENPEIFDSGELDWETAVWQDKIKWRGGALSDSEKTKKIEQYRAALFEYDVRRISLFQQAGAKGEGMTLVDGSTLTPEACLDAADLYTEQLEQYKRIDRNPETGDFVPYMTPEQANAIKGETAKARQNYTMLLSKRQGDNAAKIDAEIDELQWKMAYPLMRAGEEFDPSKAVGVEMEDENQFFKKLQNAVDTKQISHEQGNRLGTRYQKLREARNQLFYDMQHPEQFAAHSDAVEWVRIKKMLTDAERSNIPLEQIEAAVEAAKSRLTAKDYYALWHDTRKKRNAEEDHLANQVFSAFLKVSEYDVATAVDPTKRGTDRAENAISTLLGSSNAEYIHSDHWYNPDFTIEDIDEAHRLIKDYLIKHPDDYMGAQKLLADLVDPASKAARAKSFRNRIIQLRRYERMKGNAGIFNVQRAFAEEDSGTQD